MKEIVKRLLTEESGQGMTEYALILALVSVVAIAALQLLGGRIDEVFRDVLAGFTTPTP
ncbi:MAG: Flp family type IVb pilin [Dethiobacter sp.]|jgi:pilus assembly protein Flp/PilA|nr:Flp family type IVb pilin [Dethiobacter sp.]MCL4464084.1 Flp family type IVb pilin [Bacillota bacterium]